METKKEREFDCNLHVQFPAACTMMVAGPTGCGKTYWVQQLLSHKDNFTQPIRSIMFCYGVFQPRYREMAKTIANLEFHQGLPTLKTVEMFRNEKFLDVIVLDDLMEQILDNRDAQALFTKICHHYNVTTIFITQNVLAQGKCARTISLNTLMLIVFQNHRDRNQALTLARQQSPRKPDLFLQAFEDATKNSHGYLVVDCTPDCDDSKRWRTCVFKNDKNFPEGKCYIPYKISATSEPVIFITSIADSKNYSKSAVLATKKKSTTLIFNTQNKKELPSSGKKRKAVDQRDSSSSEQESESDQPESDSESESSAESESESVSESDSNENLFRKKKRAKK